MVLGAPRELLAHIRPNLVSPDELAVPMRSDKLGYYGAPFVPEPTDASPVPAEQSYGSPPYDFVRGTGKPLNAYENHFAQQITKLAAGNHVKLALLHIPIDSELGLGYMPERARWVDALHTNAPIIGVPSNVLFKNTDATIVHNYYRDQHFNINGSLLFTRTIVPAILKAYDERQTND
jgi:hypothetical protein